MGLQTQFTERFDEAMRKIQGHMTERMLEASQEVRNKAVEKLSGPRTGRVYKVPGTNRTYIASAPGEPPAVQVGDLRKSVKSGVEKDGRDVIGFVGSDLPKAPMLEYGTRKMAARPWLWLKKMRLTLSCSML